MNALISPAQPGAARTVAPAVAGLFGPAQDSSRVLIQALTLNAPMVGVESARLALRCDEAALTGWILSGDIEWAFDLRRQNAKRWYVRILTESVVVKQKHPGPFGVNERRSQRRHRFQDIFDSLFPPRRLHFHSSEMARIWGCGVSHIHNLVQDGLLGGNEAKSARHDGFQIPRENILQLMQSRRIQ
jgi:hypothetical protein